MMSRWLGVAIVGFVLSIALGAGATVAVLAATSSGGDEDRSPAPAGALVEQNEERPWLGVIVSKFGDEGLIVQQVFADSPAHKAGVKRGDIIKAIQGKDVQSIRELVAELDDRGPGDEVTLTLLRDDEEMSLQVTLGERPEPLRPPEPKGPFAELGELEFADILGGRFRVKDDEGNTVVVEVVAGEVARISDDELTVTANDGSERTFTITGDTVMSRRPEEGDPVVVVTVGENNEARLVLPGMFERLRERLMPPELPWLDIPRRLREPGLDLIPGQRFHLWPRWGPELMPLPEEPR
jgi:membrane-associated protease RseP (regulator of RpoE activity)